MCRMWRCRIVDGSNGTTQMATEGNRELSTLLIDKAAAAMPPPEDVSAWAADQRVFISSVMAGMTDERVAAASAVAEIGAEPVMFETFGGRDADPEAAYVD